MKLQSLLVALLTLGLLATSAPARAEDYTLPAGCLFLGGLSAFENFSDSKREIAPDGSLGFDFDVLAQEGDVARLTLETENIKGIFPVGRLYRS